MTSMTWAQFEAASPDVAVFGRQRLQRRIAYLATTRLDGSPRVHPVSPVITEHHLFVYMERTSPKGRDLRRDPRYSMHAAVEDNSGGKGEFQVSGRAEVIEDTKTREEAFEQARSDGYEPLERYVLFELRVEEALGTVYEEGEPKRTRWKAA